MQVTTDDRNDTFTIMDIFCLVNQLNLWVRYSNSAQHLSSSITLLISRQYCWLWCIFCRSVSQVADVNIQSSVGMFSFCYVLHNFECVLYTVLLCILIISFLFVYLSFVDYLLLLLPAYFTIASCVMSTCQSLYLLHLMLVLAFHNSLYSELLLFILILFLITQFCSKQSCAVVHAV